MLSGEWSILEPGNPALVMAISKRVYVEIEEAETIHVKLDDFGLEATGTLKNGTLTWNTTEQTTRDKLMFTKGAIETVTSYLGNDKPFRLRTWGDETVVEIDGEKRKVGFGSSAASVVAVVGAILQFHGHDISKRETKDLVYKLSLATHFKTQGKIGSGFDVAASTYGGIFEYQSNPTWLSAKLDSGQSVNELVTKQWEGFLVNELSISDTFHLLIGWTKESASTTTMVKQMKAYKAATPDAYTNAITTVAAAAKKAVTAMKNNNTKAFLAALQTNEDALRELGTVSGVNIETPELKQMSDLANAAGAAGKLSGAGGGDCGIGVCFDEETANKVRTSWKEHNIYVVDATLDRDGVRVDA